jgi:hypothetical protein
MNNIDIFDVVKPKTKLFGERAARVTTAEMNAVFDEIKQIFKYGIINRMACSKPLPNKEDHGDIDIVVENIPNMDTKEYVRSNLVYAYDKNYLIETVHNGPILHCLFDSETIGKQVHVDFIFATPAEYDSTLMYLAYNDFSGILGVVARRLKFNYGNKGMFKIYVDKKGQYHYILLSHNLVDGLRMLGYADIIHKYYTIQHNDDIAKFIGYTDLFDSNYLSSNDLNRGDRKRLRSSRPTARDCRNKLIELNKKRTQSDDNFYLKLLFPEIYKDYLEKCNHIENFVYPKSKYGGDFIKFHFPNVKPGPVFKNILLEWNKKYEKNLDNISEEELIEFTKQLLK